MFNKYWIDTNCIKFYNVYKRVTVKSGMSFITHAFFVFLIDIINVYIT